MKYNLKAKLKRLKLLLMYPWYYLQGWKYYEITDVQGNIMSYGLCWGLHKNGTCEKVKPYFATWGKK